jgi:hypothetical protein
MEETAIVELVLAHVAAETGMDLEALTVTEMEAQEWPNAGLGCPKPDEMYMQMITPGYLVQVQGGEETFNVHTNADGSVIVICEPLEARSSGDGPTPTTGAGRATPMPPALPPSLTGDAADVARLAIERVAGESGIAQDALRVTSYSKEMWPDSGLGCRQPGMMYMQVITPGYKFVIEGEGERFNVHTDQSGNSIVICR